MLGLPPSRSIIVRVSSCSLISACLLVMSGVIYRYAFCRWREWRKRNTTADAQASFEAGTKALARQNFKEAIDCFTTSISRYSKDHPNFLASLLNRAAAYSSSGDNTASLKDYDRVLRVDQLNRSAILGRSFVHEAIGNLEMAIEDMVALITVDPHDSVESKARLERLLCRYAERCSKEVRSVKRNSFESKWAVEKFLRCFRSEWAVLAKAEAGSPLGLVLQKIQTCDYELALDHLKQVAVESPSAVMYNLIGTLHLLAGNMRDSQAALLKSLELFPANAPVLVKCALVSMELGKYSEMTEYIEEGLTVDSQDPAIYYFRGEILAMCDNFEAAIDDFARAIQLDNAFIYAHVSHARANLALGRIQAAQDLLKEPMNAFSEDPELLHVFGETLVLQGNIKEGLSTWLQVLDLAPDFPDIHLNLAVLNHTINGCESAYEAALLAIVEKFPHFGAGHIQLAQHYLVKGKLEKATHHFDTAISRARSLQESITMCSLKAISVAKAQVAARIPECHPGLSILRSPGTLNAYSASIRPQMFIHGFK